MTDYSNILLSFDKKISLSKTELKYLRNSRSAIIKKIKLYFDEHTQCPKVEFKGQGSFSMGTIVKPIVGDYDIDIGLYLKGQSNWLDDWPKPETVSQWLVQALATHTTTKPINKKTCIRICYQPLTANKEVAYHIDIPIYCQYTNLFGTRKTRIGLNGDEQWSNKSEPIEFIKWFYDKCNQNTKDNKQLIRLVKYIKAWKDYNKGEIKFPSGMALSILFANNFSPNKREDLAFYETLKKVETTLYGFWGEERIASPVEPYSDLLIKLTTNQKQFFKEKIEALVADIHKIIHETEKEKAIQILQHQFGKRI